MRGRRLWVMALGETGVAWDDGVWFALEGLWGPEVFFRRLWGRTWTRDVVIVTA